MARPKKVIDVEQLKQLAAINCSLKEISLILNVDEKTLTSRFSQVLALGRSQGSMSLKRKAFKMATEQGNTSMMIFLLKNQCGYTDRIIHDGPESPTREDYARPGSMQAIKDL